MVVVRGNTSELLKEMGNSLLSEISEASGVFGYSVDESGPELKIEFNPDRLDLCSIDLLVSSIQKYNGKPSQESDLKFSGKSLVRVTEEAFRLRPYVGIVVAKGPHIGRMKERLISFQEKLHDTIGKDRSRASIGIHDLGNVRIPFSVDVEDRQKTRMVSYDGMEGTIEDIFKGHEKGVEYASLVNSQNQAIVIRDADGDLMSVPPVINGIKSRISEDTDCFIIDFTGIDFISVRGTIFLISKCLQAMGYAVTIHPVAEGMKVHQLRDFHMRTVEVKKSSIFRLTGHDIPTTSVMSSLVRMGYEVSSEHGAFMVRVPGYRIDVMGEVDVIEDIVKAYGLENIEAKPISIPLFGKPDSMKDFQDTCRTVLIGLQLQEVSSFVVTAEKFYQNLNYLGGVRILNPKSMDNSIVRDRIFPNLLEFLRINKRRSLPLRIFEIGDIFIEEMQQTHLCVMVEESRGDFSAAKKVLDQYMERIVDQKPLIRSSDIEGLIPGRSGTIHVGGKEIGFIGEVHPEFLSFFELQNPVSLLEIRLDLLHEVAGA
ncbi:MAG: phenylalanine--tRNA ligase subunit beta [Candidatus Thermoplasmatota archaeon]|nr:phenylalanine--tRNA ligase subunit beta [Candidatus Thermoplasmatota archaeon]MCL5438310.1 phenylalanine--tRNA ligase subunit beta [Candidatus Thermoplasmatota archaeon]